MLLVMFVASLTAAASGILGALIVQGGWTADGWAAVGQWLGALGTIAAGTFVYLQLRDGRKVLHLALDTYVAAQEERRHIERMRRLAHARSLIVRFEQRSVEQLNAPDFPNPIYTMKWNIHLVNTSPAPFLEIAAVALWHNSRDVDKFASTDFGLLDGHDETSIELDMEFTPQDEMWQHDFDSGFLDPTFVVLFRDEDSACWAKVVGQSDLMTSTPFTHKGVADVAMDAVRRAPLRYT